MHEVFAGSKLMIRVASITLPTLYYACVGVGTESVALRACYIRLLISHVNRQEPVTQSTSAARLGILIIEVRPARHLMRGQLSVRQWKMSKASLSSPADLSLKPMMTPQTLNGIRDFNDKVVQ